jgi:hypothetical protein
MNREGVIEEENENNEDEDRAATAAANLARNIPALKSLAHDIGDFELFS